MINGLPCPNPTCKQVFATQALATGTGDLVCPRCGTRFQFRNPNAGARPASVPPARPMAPSTRPPVARPAPPTARPVAPPPARPGIPIPPPVAGYYRPGGPPPPPIPVAALAVPVAAVGPGAPPPPPASTGFSFDGSAPVPPEIRRRRRGRLLGALKTSFVLLILGGIVGAGAWYLSKHPEWLLFDLRPKSDPTGAMVSSGPGPTELPALNFSYQFPSEAVWKRDPGAMAVVGANLFALKRERPTLAWMSLASKDYKTFNPREGEVGQEIIDRLSKNFNPFEYEVKGEGQLAGKRALRVKFVGQQNGARVEGDVYILINQGVVYTLTTWAPDDKAAAEEFNDLRKRFALLNRRENWVDERNRPHDFAGLKAPYALTDMQSMWQPDPVKGEFTKADLALKGKDPLEPDKPTFAASVVVLMLPKADDLAGATAAARTLLTDQIKKDFPDSKPEMDVLKGQDGPLDKDGFVGAAPGHITKLRVTSPEDRFITQAVVFRPEGSLVIQCDCAFERRSLWESDFDTLIASFRLTTAAPPPDKPPTVKEKPTAKDKPTPEATTKEK
jgi:hypothetical protein